MAFGLLVDRTAPPLFTGVKAIDTMVTKIIITKVIIIFIIIMKVTTW